MYTSGHKKTTGILEGGLVEFLCCEDTLIKTGGRKEVVSIVRNTI
jgi:hypothetical protein